MEVSAYAGVSEYTAFPVYQFASSETLNRPNQSIDHSVKSNLSMKTY